MPTTHMKYGGSTIERTELCPGSAKAVSDLPEGSPGKAAERGTEIHAILEKLLVGKKPAKTAAKAYVAVAQSAHAALLETAAELGFSPVDFLIEQSVVLKHLHPEAGGTPDIAAVKPFRDLMIVDLKTGYNYVSADENIQLLFYASGVMRSLDEFTQATLENLHLIILQPEQEAPYTTHVRKWSIPLAKLPEYEARFKAAIDRAEANPDLRIAGTHCEAKYCGARSFCTEYRTWLNDQSAGLFQQVIDGEINSKNVSAKVKEVYGENLAKLLSVGGLFKKLHDEAKANAIALLKKDPTSVPGYKLDDALSDRIWKDPKEIEKALKDLGLKIDEISPRHPLGPAPVEKLLKAKGLELDVTAFTIRPVTGVTLKKGDAIDPADLFADSAPKPLPSLNASDAAGAMNATQSAASVDGAAVTVSTDQQQEDAAFAALR